MEDLVFIAPQRSGHHAIINWIAKQHPALITHYNDIRGREKGNRQTKYGGRGGNCNFFNVENTVYLKALDLINKNKIIQKKAKKILVLRDCYNNFASAMIYLLKKKSRARLQRVVDTWISIAKQIINDDNVDYFILYDQWFSDVNYRKQICDDLGLEFTDNGLQEVRNFGGGSSFDGTKMNKNAQNMSVLRRYERYQNNKDYLKLFTDEIKEYNKIIFGNDCPF